MTNIKIAPVHTDTTRRVY